MENFKKTYEDLISRIVFMLANMVSIDHVSDLNILRCHPLYCLFKEDYFVDVAKIIC